MRQFYFLVSILLLLPILAGAQTQKFNFTVENNSAMNFENGSYIIEVIELDKFTTYARVNITFSGQSKINNIYDGETPLPFGQIKISSSSITSTKATINVEFPDGWAFPKIYQIVRPTAPVGIPNLIVTRTVDKTNLNVGDVLSFTINVENTGNATAYNITLTERLPNGFSSAAGSRFPPVITNKLEPGESQELYYALKAVDPGTFTIEPTIVNYGSKTAKSNQITITVAGVVEEKSNLSTEINIEKKDVFTEDPFKVSIRITNTGKAQAKSVLIDGTTPIGLRVIEGDLRQVYESIAPGEQKEYRVILKADEAGNYSINLRTIYNDYSIGVSSSSGTITVTGKEKNYLYIIIPVTAMVLGFVMFTIRKHKEYKY